MHIRGARGCIGRKFSETEAIVVITKIVSRYTIKIAEDPNFAGESFEQRKARVMALTPGMTTTYVSRSLSQYFS